MQEKLTSADEAHSMIVTTSDLSRSPAKVLARVARGERLLVCRHRRPVATLQPIDGVVVQPFTGGATDIFGWPVGGALDEAAKLNECQRALLTHCIRGLRMISGRLPDHLARDRMPSLRDLLVRGLVRKTGYKWELTGRGLVMHEALAAQAAARRPRPPAS